MMWLAAYTADDLAVYMYNEGLGAAGVLIVSVCVLFLISTAIGMLAIVRGSEL